VKLSKLAIVLGTTLVLILPTGGCSSKEEDKQPKLSGPGNPNLKRVGQGVGGGAPAKAAAGPKAEGPVSKP